jgi:hypothetical protein
MVDMAQILVTYIAHIEGFLLHYDTKISVARQ